MLASPPVHAVRERTGRGGLAAAAGTGALAFSALFFSGGFAIAPLVWIGGLALLLAALLASAPLLRLAPGPRLDAPAAAFAGCLLGLVVWVGASTLWSLSPDRSWGYTNRTLVYVAFALVGLALAARLPRPAARGADAAAALLALVLGWALLAKCVPALYSDYGRVARLRAPVGYWNDLALLAAVAVPLALRLAAPRTRSAGTRAAGAVLLYAAVLVALLSYSRVGIVLAVLGAAAFAVLERDRVETVVAAVLAGGAGAAVFAIALSLPGITKDGQPRSVRAHDGWHFALSVLAGGALVAALAILLARAEARRPLAAVRRRVLERTAAIVALVAVVAGLGVAAVFAGRIWHDFANPATSQISSSSSHAFSLSSSNRWRWWVEEWHAFTTHPLLGTGAGTFQLTDWRYRQSSLVTTTEPHNTPLQFLGELGIVGFLLFLGAVGAAVVGVARAWRRAEGAERAGVTALGIGLGAFALHLVVDMDWNFLAVCGPLLLVAGFLLGRPAAPAPGPARSRKPLVAAAAALIAVGGIYSLAAPWLAQRQLATAASAAAFKSAHGYDPLSTDVLSTWAAYEAVTGNLGRALQLYRDETALEPENGNTWVDLGTFYYDNGAWAQAYEALSKAWRYDPQGPTGTPCGILDKARHKALGTWPPSCPRGA